MPMSLVPKSPPQSDLQLSPTNSYPLPILSFSVKVGHNAAAQPWVPAAFTDLTLIKNTANESILEFPNFEQVLRQWAMQLQAHHN